jgi:predicted Zn-dependent protease
MPGIEEEYALGGSVALNWIQRGGGLLPVKEHEALLRYINPVGRNLGAQSSRPTLQWTFGVLRTTDSFEAISAPGGYTFVTLGLLQGVDNEAQLAGVLAHEIAHISSQDSLKRYAQLKVRQCKVARGEPVEGGLLVQLNVLSDKAALALNKAVTHVTGALDLDSNPELLANLADNFVSTFTQSGLSQDEEFAADAQAVRLMVSAGYDPQEYLRFLAKIPDSRKVFANHPRKVERVKRLVALLKENQQSGPEFPELAAGSEGLVKPPLPPEFASVKGAVAHDAP